MIFPINHLSVNWIDGMKISKNHFIETDNHGHDAIRDAISIPLTNFNFGLLPVPKGSREVFDFQMAEQAGNYLEIRLKSCNAITPGGSRIAITSAIQDNGSGLVSTIKGSSLSISNTNEVSWYEVLLIVNPYESVPVGNPDLEENPPRHPYKNTKYHLEVIPSEQLNNEELGPYHLVIGRIKNKGGQLTALQNYIPPCTSVESHPQLVRYYETFAVSWQNIHNYCLKILKKIAEKNKPSSIAKNYKLLCEKVLEYNANTFFHFRNVIPQSSPIYLAGCFSALANTIYLTLYTISAEEREELLKYTFEWCDITPNDFEESLLNALGIRYNHYQIADSMEIIQQTLHSLNVVWSKMDSLEFIGQRKENIVVTKETIQQVTEQPKKRWSILD